MLDLIVKKEGVSMSGKTADKIRIPLAGDWSMNGVTHQIPHLVEQLASLSGSLSSKESQTCAAANPPEVVLSGIDELDASGCQLMATFLHNLKQRGVMPLLTDVPDAIKEKIQFLGFGRELGSYFKTLQVCV
jgi:anti-anti-sigma regulatory factor